MLLKFTCRRQQTVVPLNSNRFLLTDFFKVRFWFAGFAALSRYIKIRLQFFFFTMLRFERKRSESRGYHCSIILAASSRRTFGGPVHKGLCWWNCIVRALQMELFKKQLLGNDYWNEILENWWKRVRSIERQFLRQGCWDLGCSECSRVNAAGSRPTICTCTWQKWRSLI